MRIELEMNKPFSSEFCRIYNLERILLYPKISSFIDQILSSKQERCLRAKAVETGLYDFRKNVVSVFKSNFI